MRATVLQASRNELVQADPVALQKEVNRLTAQLADLRGSTSAAALVVVQAELMAATVAGGCLAEELAAAEHALRSTQVEPTIFDYSFLSAAIFVIHFETPYGVHHLPSACIPLSNPQLVVRACATQHLW